MEGSGRMLPIPTVFDLVAGGGEGGTPLMAFDGALRAAGVADVNLIRVSSILPAGAGRVKGLARELPRGILLPTAYGTIGSSVPGDEIAAAVAIGIGHVADPGVIVEYTHRGSREEAEQVVYDMVLEAFRGRGRPRPDEILVKGISHRVEEVGAAFAGVILWYR